MRTHFIKEIKQMEDTHWWHRAKREIIASVIQKEIDKSKKKLRILEIGAGTSLLIKEFIHSADTFALDRSKTALALSKKNGIGNTIHADLGTYSGYKKNFYDIVVAADVLEHLEDDFGAVKKIHDMLKKGGIFIIHVPAHQSLFSYWDKSLGHYRRYEKADLKKLIKHSPFTISFLSFRLPSAYPFVRIFRMLSSNTNKKRKSDFEQFSLLNLPLYLYTRTEDALIRRKLIHPPFGLSLFAIAKKK